MLSINISETIWTVINFFLLFFLLKHFLYTPVLRFMEKRQAGIDAKLNVERDAKTQVAENEERLLTEKEKSREEAKNILAQTGEELDRQRAAAIAEAKAGAAQALKDGQAALTAKREITADKLHDAAPELAELLANRLIDGE